MNAMNFEIAATTATQPHSAKKGAFDLSHFFGPANKAEKVKPSKKDATAKLVEDVLKAGDELVEKNKAYKENFVVRGHEALYELLAGIYELALRVDQHAERDHILKGIRKVLKDREIKVQGNTPVMTMIVKYVVGGTDRQTASNYSRVLKVAMQENLAADELAEYISRRGGIAAIHETEQQAAAKQAARGTEKERIDLLREFFSFAHILDGETFKYNGGTIQHNAENQSMSEEAVFAIFVTVYDHVTKTYHVVSSNDLGATQEDKLIAFLGKDLPENLNVLRRGVAKLKLQYANDYAEGDYADFLREQAQAVLGKKQASGAVPQDGKEVQNIEAATE